MGIDIALYEGRPNNGRRTSPTMLHLSTDHGQALAEALAAHADPSGHRLHRIDPYGDTLFNEQDAGAAFEEATTLLARCTTEEQRAAVRDLRNLLAHCAATPGSWVAFHGD
ncbi:hypothetical protein [Streptomyces sp. FH025]|uniref:hypothetical protein n=1 Tax=Streptomyces sp. FH025 TaxID=2815937 RepID=UPI001A9CD0EC|nr:hypothetical protein [Streptomyces sp. FH025]MBO1416365.1 hypothetical protein [Streptomyces sp. FH025]